MKEVREITGIARWVFETIWIGNAVLFRFLGQCFRLSEALQPMRRCPRGHLSPMHNAYLCKCGAVFEGWVFAPCPVCHQSAGWTPCVKCSLPIKNPWL